MHLKTWVLGSFFSHGKKISGAFGACHILCTCCSSELEVQHLGRPFPAFCDCGWAKMAFNGFRMGSFHLFVQPKWSRMIFGKMHLGPIFGPKTTHFQGIL